MFGHLPSHKQRFIRMLEKREKRALVHAFAYLAQLDNKLLRVETDPIDDLAREIGLDPRSVVEDVGTSDLDGMLAAIEDEQAKRIIIQEVISFAYADGEYSQEEQTSVRHMAKMLRIEPERLNAIEDWVKKGQDWIQEGIQLILDKEVHNA